MGLESIVKTYTEYVPGGEMLETVKNADAIAFLVDKSIGENCRIYNRYKATGSSVFCLSFGIPCIVSDDFVLDCGLEKKAILYHGSHIETVFEDIMTGKISKEDFKRLKAVPLDNGYSPEYQRRHYRSLLGVYNG
ncbi:hypothetical protein AGMMS49928_17450 [Spirochaetia bacterium]|nr:hypothetical protein AGMMS49928_17450 [Spirochaetia bacterium]